MRANNSNANHERGDENGSNAGEEDNNNGGNNQDDEGLAIGELAAEKGDRRVRGLTEEIEEQPCGEKAGEEDQGEGICQKRDDEHSCDDGEVVNAEIVIIFPDAAGGFGDGIGFGEGGAVAELRPWATVGEAMADGVGDAGEESTQGGAGGGLLVVDGG